MTFILRFAAVVMMSTVAITAVLCIDVIINAITSAANAIAYPHIPIIAARGSNDRVSIVEFNLLSERGRILSFHTVILPFL